MSSLPIGDHALPSDRHSAGLVSSGGSVDWLCMPRFDSPSIFAAILDDEAGHWSIRPHGDFDVERRCVAASMALLTTFHTSQGTLEQRDALALGGVRDPHALGEHAPHLLARTVACTRGHVGMRMSFTPRPGYGLIAPMTTPVDGAASSPCPRPQPRREPGVLAEPRERHRGRHRRGRVAPDPRGRRRPRRPTRRGVLEVPQAWLQPRPGQLVGRARRRATGAHPQAGSRVVQLPRRRDPVHLRRVTARVDAAR